MLSTYFGILKSSSGPVCGVHWSIPLKGDVLSISSISSNNSFYVGSNDGYLFSLTLNGGLNWKRLTNNSVFSIPGIGPEGTISIGSYDYYLYSFYPDGRMKFKFYTGSYIYSSPIYDIYGNIYFGSYDNNLYSISSDGKLNWKYATSGTILSTPAINSIGTIFVGSLDYFIYAISNYGQLIWKYGTGGWLYSSPMIGIDGTIYIGSYDYYFYAFSPTGQIKWKYLTGSSIITNPIIGSNGFIYISSYDKYLYAFTSSGQLQWKYKSIEALSISPVVGFDNTVYFVLSKNIYAITAQGMLWWSYGLNATVSSIRVGSDGIFYISFSNGFINSIYCNADPPTSSPTTPSFQPTIYPTSPTTQPTSYPSRTPSIQPTVAPSFLPTLAPTSRLQFGLIRQYTFHQKSLHDSSPTAGSASYENDLTAPLGLSFKAGFDGEAASAAYLNYTVGQYLRSRKGYDQNIFSNAITLAFWFQLNMFSLSYPVKIPVISIGNTRLTYLYPSNDSRCHSDIQIYLNIYPTTFVVEVVSLTSSCAENVLKSLQVNINMKNDMSAWYHVSVVYSKLNNNTSIYVNGIRQIQQYKISLEYMNISSFDWLILGFDNNTNYHNITHLNKEGVLGLALDDVRIYTVDLSAADILDLYMLSLQTPSSSPTALPSTSTSGILHLNDLNILFAHI